MDWPLAGTRGGGNDARHRGTWNPTDSTARLRGPS
jgi:hypothetical protein